MDVTSPAVIACIRTNRVQTHILYMKRTTILWVHSTWYWSKSMPVIKSFGKQHSSMHLSNNFLNWIKWMFKLCSQCSFHSNFFSNITHISYACSLFVWQRPCSHTSMLVRSTECKLRMQTWKMHCFHVTSLQRGFSPMCGNCALKICVQLELSNCDAIVPWLLSVS